ncbi:MAG: hypothetical protein WD557_15010 [Dehalococcoidia bacterium]
MDEATLELIRTRQLSAAVRRIEADGLHEEVAWRYDEAVRELYWKAKDLPGAISIGRAGIAHCLRRMDEASEPGARDFFGTRAKAMAFNVASFSWPGWAEQGIVPSDADLAAGMDAAKLNLRLAEELSKPADRVEDARWLLGAHLLAAGDVVGALREFEQSGPERRPLYRGYALVAEIALGRDGADVRFDDLVARLREDRDDDSSAHADQLATARRVFAGR